jgi:hypothetical protein
MSASVVKALGVAVLWGPAQLSKLGSSFMKCTSYCHGDWPLAASIGLPLGSVFAAVRLSRWKCWLLLWRCVCCGAENPARSNG